MSDPYVGQIRMMGCNFAPVGYALCDGQLLSIAEYDVLFNLIGTTYGGDGVNNFALPDLRGRIPVHQGQGYVIGQMNGSENVTLTVNQLPAHAHPARASNGIGGTAQDSPTGAYWNKWTGAAYSSAAPDGPLHPAAVSAFGGNQPHDNMPPFLAINFVISLFGVFPSQG